MEKTTQQKRAEALIKAREAKKANKEIEQSIEGVQLVEHPVDKVVDNIVDKPVEKSVNVKTDKELELEDLERARRARSRYMEDLRDGNFNSKLAIPRHLLDDKNFYYRWSNDDDKGNLVNVKNKGYIHVRDSSITSEVNGVVARRVGVKKDGTPLYAYLMKTPIEFRKQDETLKQKGIDKLEEQLNRGEVKSINGDTSDGLTTDGRISIKHGA